MPDKAIWIRGVVQGVGFRPAIWHLAKQYSVTGEVWNDGFGMMIHAFGTETDLDAFIRQIPLQLPPLA
ncbi:acylphosphatase [Methylomonas sp. AM2-LC]|uniref:acylphosphatase n=1 Tax=Methylomonas sp. AM2-LC TaxID=3153301 RepID=UPI0032667A36